MVSIEFASWIGHFQLIKSIFVFICKKKKKNFDSCLDNKTKGGLLCADLERNPEREFIQPDN